MNSRRPALKFIFITLVLDILGIGLIIPILPKLIESFRGGDTSSASITFGLLASLYALMQFLFAPMVGSLSDRFGRRTVILSSLFGSGADYLLLAFAPTLPWFFVGRIVAGITGANITAAMAYIADVTPPEKRAQSYGLVGAAFGLGFILGPALGGILGASNLRVPFMVAGGLTLLNWLYGYFVLPESLAKENRRAFSWARSNPVGSLLALRRHPVVFRLTATLFLTNIAQYSLHSTWVLYTGYRYNWTSGQVGASLAVVGLMAAIVQGGLVRRVVPKFGEEKCVIGGLIIAACGYFGYAIASKGWMIYLVLAFASLGAVAGPSLQSIISRGVGADEQGGVQGALTSLGSVAGIIAPPIATNLFAFFISKKAPIHLPGATFYFSGTLILIGTFLAFLSLKHRLSPQPVAESKPS